MFAEGRASSAPSLRTEGGTKAFSLEHPGIWSPSKGLLRENGEDGKAGWSGVASSDAIRTGHKSSQRRTSWADSMEVTSEIDNAAIDASVRGLPHIRPASMIAAMGCDKVETEQMTAQAPGDPGGSGMPLSGVVSSPRDDPVPEVEENEIKGNIGEEDIIYGEFELPPDSSKEHWQLSHHLPAERLEEAEPPDPLTDLGLHVGRRGNGRSPLPRI